MRPTIFCLMPVKNEEWIIERSLSSASIWADKIIVSDQGSTDRTVEIARRFPKVTLLDNSKVEEFNEQEMRAPLFAEARKYSGKKLLISLDADEIFTPNFDSPEWNSMLNAEEGTRFIFNWYHILPDYENVFTTIYNTCAFMDDGSEYNVGLIHVPRQPIPVRPVLQIKLNDISILHFQFINWERMERKHIWYQMYERIFYPKKSCISIYRGLHYDKHFLERYKKIPLNREWIDGYKTYKIDITTVHLVPCYIWDEVIIKYLNTYPKKYFNRIDMWNINWVEKIDKNVSFEKTKFEDKRTVLDKALMYYLRRTQGRKDTLGIKIIDRILKFLFR